MSTASAGRVVIVGGSLAGATTALTLRQTGYQGEIVLLGAETELPYERPALSKGYLSGDIAFDKLLVHPAEVYDEHDIALRLGEAATGLDVDRQQVLLASGEALAFTDVVVATGSGNIRPPIPGIDLGGVHQLRSVADADGLRAELPGLSRAVIVGQGFIGCEIAATLTSLGVQVTAVDAMPGPLWGPLGPELSDLVRRWHEARGVRLVNGVGVRAFLSDGSEMQVAGVELADGQRIDAELVVVGVGVRPATDWLHDPPVHLVRGAVGVDVDGRTNRPHVYAAGDVTATWDAARGDHLRHEHWASAIDQGQRVARAIAGVPQLVEPAVPYFWSDQYDRNLQYAGSHDTDCELIVRGDLSQTDGPLVAFFLRAGVLAGVLTVNSGKQLRRAQRLVGHPLDRDALADPTVDLRRLAPLVPAAR
jgi:3-phenylpropionate/trans-cinnamate dioxygenase ferredoxin reductase subunit